jgi:hypothetical protein
MIKTDFMNLYEELSELYESELTEVKAVNDFESGSETAFYHFFEDLADLVNSLDVKRIYSNKNEQASQLDLSAPEGSSYVCMTVGQEGKRRTTTNFGNRAFGVSFKDLTKMCNDRQYVFDPEASGEYSQFLAKTQYDIGSEGMPTATSSDDKVTAFRDFELLAIGQFANGEYFISGGQGRNLSSHWSSKTFTDENIYKILRAWFMTNMDAKQLEKNPDAAQPHIYYHLEDITSEADVHQPKNPDTDIFIKGNTKHILNSVKQHNDNYRPRPDEAGSDSFERAIDFGSFEMAEGVQCKEIIGVGPLRVTDSTGQVILQLDMCTPGAKGGYQPPKVFSALANVLDDKSRYAEIDNYTPGRPMQLKTIPEYKSRPNHLLLTKDTANFIADLFNESEHRVYIPNKKDLVFRPDDIEAIVLPAIITTPSSRTYNIQKLLQAVVYGVINDYDSKATFLQALKDAGVIGSKVRLINDHVYENLVKLVQLLTSSEYDHVLVELIDREGRAVSTLNLKTQYGISGGTDHLEYKDGKYTNPDAKMRYIPEDDIKDFNIMREISNPEVKKWNNVDSVIADIDVLGGKARLGAETIVVGQDSKGTDYVLFVDNAYKATGFLELPGGGLNKADVTSEAFYNTAMQRLKFKCNIDPQDLEGGKLTDTGKGLLLVEKGKDGTKGVAKDAAVTWQYSYYKLFTARYTKPIDDEDTDYSFDNHGLLTTAPAGEVGYTSYSKWIPIRSLNHNRGLLTRYSNVFPTIQSLIKKV